MLRLDVQRFLWPVNYIIYSGPLKLHLGVYLCTHITNYSYTHGMYSRPPFPPIESFGSLPHPISSLPSEHAPDTPLHNHLANLLTLIGNGAVASVIHNTFVNY